MHCDTEGHEVVTALGACAFKALLERRAEALARVRAAGVDMDQVLDDRRRAGVRSDLEAARAGAALTAARAALADADYELVKFQEDRQ